MNQARLRRWAAWGAKNGPDWFVKVAPVLIGIAAFLVAHRARSCVFVNQRRIHGRREICLEIWDALQTFIAFAHNLTESLYPERFSKGRRLILRGRTTADEVMRDHGVIIATAHVGPWDSAAMMFSQMSERPVLMLMAGEQDDAAAQVQDYVRNGENIRVLRLGQSPLTALYALEHLAQRKVVVAQMDRTFGRRAPTETQLFEQPFSMSPGLVRLAAISTCPILPVFTARLSATDHLVQVGEPIWVQARPSASQIRAALEQYLRQLESHLEQFPTQWFHFIREDKVQADQS